MLNVWPTGLAYRAQVETIPGCNEFSLRFAEGIAVGHLVNLCRMAVVLTLGTKNGIRHSDIKTFHRHRIALLICAASEHQGVPSFLDVPAKAQESRGSGERMVVHERHTARLDAFIGSKHLRTSAGGALHHVAHRIVKAIGGMRQLGEFSRPTSPGPIKDHRDLVSLLFTF